MRGGTVAARTVARSLLSLRRPFFPSSLPTHRNVPLPSSQRAGRAKSVAHLPGGPSGAWRPPCTDAHAPLGGSRHASAAAAARRRRGRPPAASFLAAPPAVRWWRRRWGGVGISAPPPRPPPLSVTAYGWCLPGMGCPRQRAGGSAIRRVRGARRRAPARLTVGGPPRSGGTPPPDRSGRRRLVRTDAAERHRPYFRQRGRGRRDHGPRSGGDVPASCMAARSLVLDRRRPSCDVRTVHIRKGAPPSRMHLQCCTDGECDGGIRQMCKKTLDNSGTGLRCRAGASPRQAPLIHDGHARAACS